MALALQGSARNSAWRWRYRAALKNSAQNTALDQFFEIGEEREAGLGEEKGTTMALRTALGGTEHRSAAMAAAGFSLTGPMDL